jgi:hypothetical protein
MTVPSRSAARRAASIASPDAARSMSLRSSAAPRAIDPNSHTSVAPAA